MAGLKQTFDEHFVHVNFDKKLAHAVYRYQIGYVNSTPEYFEFFGSNLLGAHVIRFKDSDVLRFFNDVLDVDYQALSEAIRKVPTIDHEYKISGDIFNLTLMYVMHRFITADTLPGNIKTQAAKDTALVFFYRSIAALMSYYFKYPTDPKIAQAAYQRLSNKFLIKQLGSWAKVMEYRATNLLNRQSIHLEALARFTDDVAIVYAINDSQGRVKDLVKNYTAEFYKVHEEGVNVAVTSGTYLDADGEETIKEKTKSVEAYVGYIQQAIVDEHTFIKDDLVGVIARINTNTSFRMVRSTLKWIHEHQNDQKYHKDISEFIALVVVQSMYLIQNNMSPKNMRDYPYILHQLKNLYLSTRTVDPDIETIRKIGYKLIKASNGKISESLTLSTRTSIILYIALRTLIGQTAT